MNGWSILVALWVTAILACASPSFADDYESGSDGSQVYPITSTAIRMVRERVEIVVLDWGQGANHGKLHVTAEFVLANETDVARTIQVAFPNPGDINDFRRCIDDHPVAVEQLKDANGDPFGPFVSKVDFAARQVRRVRVQYEGETDATSGWDYPHDWRYVLKTGAHWKGRMDEAVVTVHFPMNMPFGGYGPFRPEAVSLSPTGYTFKGQTATWTFRNFKPTEDIMLHWSGSSALAASSPLKYASPEEAPGLQLAMAQAMSEHYAIKALKALRKVYPDSREAQEVDYQIARQYCWHWHWQENGAVRFGKAGLAEPLKAIAHYEAALKRPLADHLRRDTLVELLVIYTLDTPDQAQADRILTLLKKEKFRRDDEDDWRLLKMVAAASPKAGQMLQENLEAKLASEEVPATASRPR